MTSKPSSKSKVTAPDDDDQAADRHDHADDEFARVLAHLRPIGQPTSNNPAAIR
jgi:hypothetical protein